MSFTIYVCLPEMLFFSLVVLDTLEPQANMPHLRTQILCHVLASTLCGCLGRSMTPALLVLFYPMNVRLFSYCR